jgi:hypothetical protein
MKSQNRLSRKPISPGGQASRGGAVDRRGGRSGGQALVERRVDRRGGRSGGQALVERRGGQAWREAWRRGVWCGVATGSFGIDQSHFPERGPRLLLRRVTGCEVGDPLHHRNARLVTIRVIAGRPATKVLAPDRSGSLRVKSPRDEFRSFHHAPWRLLLVRRATIEGAGAAPCQMKANGARRPRRNSTGW